MAEAPRAVFGFEGPASEPAAVGLSPAALLKPHLQQLKECFDEGLLTQEEFQREKALLLQSTRPA